MFLSDQFSSQIFSGFFVLGVAFVVGFIVKRYSFFQKALKIPTPQPTHFLVGNLLELWLRRDNVAEYGISACREAHKRELITHSFLIATFRLTSCFTQKILGNKKFLNRGWPSRKFTHGFVSLVSLADGEWKARRNLVAPSYVPSVIENFVPKILHNTELILADLAATNSNSIAALPIVSQHIVSITLETSLGLKKGGPSDMRIGLANSMTNFVESQVGRINRLYTWNDELAQVYNWFHGIQDESSIMKKYAQQIVEARIAERNTEAHENGIDLTQQTKVRNQAFLDNMLDNFINNSHTADGMKELIDELIFIMITSLETVSNTTMWFLHNMAHNPDVQEKLYEELLDFNEKNENITICQLNELTYLDQCLKENLRMHPPVAFMVRLIDEDITLDDYIIPGGTLSATFIYYIHHDNEIYPEPMKFDPSRFAPENIAKIPSGAYIPFGDGPRRCIGERLAILEAKIILSNIIKRFRIEPAEMEESQLQINLLTRPERPLKFKFIPRS
ncbi:cytochrome P450 4C1-like [Brevipalpus obovatus]|uniref:cytochrome P450 4C1-like n=1 Tax=Brevipalpus obovatus TaxID=246614 RepID=UPI003D9EF81B